MTYKARTCVAFLLLSLLACGLAATGAQAQQTQAEQVTRLMQFAANNTGFDEAVKTKAKDIFLNQVRACGSADKVVRQLPSPYGELAFPEDPDNTFPYPGRGVWAEHVKIVGCNKLWLINILAVARKAAGAPMLLTLLPGETKTDPGTYGSTEKTGGAVIRKADSDSCADTPKAIYTKFLGYRQPNQTLATTDSNLGWFEEWTYRFCQQTIPVQMAFTPNTKGGTDVKARIANASPVQPPAQKPAQKPDASVSGTPSAATTGTAGAATAPASPAATPR